MARPTKVAPSSLVEESPNCRGFLKSFLLDGPIARTNVFREAENMGLPWEKVKEEFAALNGREYVQRGEYFWRIYPE